MCVVRTRSTGQRPSGKGLHCRQWVQGEHGAKFTALRGLCSRTRLSELGLGWGRDAPPLGVRT